jgi:hypothetical protein
MRPSSFLTRHRGPTWAVALGVFLMAGACRDGSPNALVAPASFAASSSSLPHINNTDIPIPVSVNATFTAEACSNNPGPRITFEGVAAVGGFGVEMTFTNNMKGTHSYTADNVVDLTFQNAGDPIVIPKQPSRGGVGGNPFIWVQFVDAAGKPTSPEYYLGRCVQGNRYGFNHAQSTSALGNAEFEITSCENSPGPFINVTAGLEYEGLGLRIIFRNNDNPVGGPHEATRSDAMTVIPSGLSYTFPKQPSQGGVGGNPWIFAGFTDGAGTAVGEATLLGRCEQLSKAIS